MKTVKDKYVLVGADFAGFPLKEVVVADLKARGWNVTDIGVKSANEDKPEMLHRIGLKVGAKITEREFERALLFCGTGTGIHIAASKCPHVHTTVVQSVAAALMVQTPVFSSKSSHSICRTSPNLAPVKEMNLKISTMGLPFLTTHSTAAALRDAISALAGIRSRTRPDFLGILTLFKGFFISTSSMSSDNHLKTLLIPL